MFKFLSSILPTHPIKARRERQARDLIAQAAAAREAERWPRHKTPVPQFVIEELQRKHFEGYARAHKRAYEDESTVGIIKNVVSDHRRAGLRARVAEMVFLKAISAELADLCRWGSGEVVYRWPTGDELAWRGDS